MNKQLLPIPALLIAIASACAPQGPYQDGLSVVTESEETRTTRFFHVNAEGEPRERKATIGVGDDCETARGSAGTLTTTTVAHVSGRFQVMGQTESSHPLVPGAAQFGTAGVSVLEHTQVTDGSSTSTETFRVPGGNPSSWEETIETVSGSDTTSGFSGVSADEYVVELNSLGDLWADLEDEASEIIVNLLTRNHPGDGAIWSSVNGNMLFVAEGTETVKVAGKDVAATKVSVYSVGDVDPTAGNVVDNCLTVDRTGFTTTQPNVDDYTVRSAHLNSGCLGSFVHQQVGTQWWHNNVLVKAALTTYEVQVVDYGYEWYSVAGNSCVRETSTTRDDRDAELFMEYAVTEVVSDLFATDWEIVND